MLPLLVSLPATAKQCPENILNLNPTLLSPSLSFHSVLSSCVWSDLLSSFRTHFGLISDSFRTRFGLISGLILLLLFIPSYIPLLGVINFHNIRWEVLPRTSWNYCAQVNPPPFHILSHLPLASLSARLHRPRPFEYLFVSVLHPLVRCS